MSKNSFSILEYKAFYTLSDCAEPYYDAEKNLILPSKTFEAIESFYYANADVQQYFAPAKKHGKKAFRAQNYVGVIQTKDGTTIEILPKIQNIDEEESKKILIKMLKTLKKSPFKNFNTANLKSSKLPLLEIFISMFLEELAKLVQKGIKSDYVTKEENLKFLKGKLKIGEQIKHNTIHKERFFVEYQEFMSDRVENRLIKTTLQYVYKKSKSNRNQQRIREFLFVFDEIKPSHDIKTDFSKVRLNRQMKDYEQVLLWCKTFLLENSFSPYKGDDVAFALLFDMNLLFESYVGDYLKKKGLDVSLQDKGKHLVEEPKKFALKPDIVIKHENEVIVADTKWKIIKEEKDISQSDMYQLFAYGKKYKNQQLYLIYPVNSEKELELFYEYENGLNLHVLFFDVKKDFKDCHFLKSIQTRDKSNSL
ncbi:MAG: McrC family protein [Sulfurimonas sp.]|uniref:McrC family protein n=1 Tax=Sulfurimonas sp. TaxID=2022749 RepID=UPI0028CBE113|nr:McrC family protein [Sulfurimonas sp.]MDT8338343.1 McrC family protein [Sulfurimonas sp.]